MLKRLFPVFGVAAISAALLVGQERPGQPGQRGKSGDKVGQPGAAVSIEGNWTVVSAARDGKAVDAADKMTVTIKGNVVTFAGGVDKNQMRAMRLDFGPQGTIRVTEAGDDGKFGDVGGPGKDRPGVGGTAVPPSDAQPGGAKGLGAADRHGPMSGVYVLTHDFLAISVFEAGAGGVRPGGPGGAPGKDPQPGKEPQPGGTGGVGAPQPGGTGTQPGGVGGGPQMKTHVSVILKRAGGAGTPGGPGKP